MFGRRWNENNLHGCVCEGKFYYFYLLNNFEILFFKTKFF